MLNPEEVEAGHSSKSDKSFHHCVRREASNAGQEEERIPIIGSVLHKDHNEEAN